MPVSIVLQWGRDREVADRYGPPRSHARLAARFNGAATVRSRIGLGTSGFWSIHARLQWGRDREVADSSHGPTRLCRRSTCFNGAATVRSRIEYGRDAPEHQDPCFNGAATVRSRIEPHPRPSRTLHTACFNGAATVRSRIAAHRWWSSLRASDYLTNLLQWGRDREVADRPTWSCVRPCEYRYLRRFNGAATVRSRIAGGLVVGEA